MNWCSSIRPGGIGQNCALISGSASIGLSTTYPFPSSSDSRGMYTAEANGFLLANCNLCCQAPEVSSGGTFTNTVTIGISLTFENDANATAFSGAFSSSTSPELTGVIAAFAARLDVDPSAVAVVVTGTGTAVTLQITVTVEASTSASVETSISRIESVAASLDNTEVQQSIISAIETAGGSSYSFSLEVNAVTSDETVSGDASTGSGDAGIATQATLSYAILSTMLSLLSLHH